MGARALLLLHNCEQDEIDSRHDFMPPLRSVRALETRSTLPSIDFWKVEAETRELFSRLATMEANTVIGKIERLQRGNLYKSCIVSTEFDRSPNLVRDKGI